MTDKDMKEVRKRLADFDRKVIGNVFDHEQKKILKAREKERKKEVSILVDMLDSTLEDCFDAYALMGSTATVHSLMNDELRTAIIHGLETKTLPVLNFMKVFFHSKEQAFTGLYDERLATVVRNLLMAINVSIRDVTQFISNLKAGWNGKGAVVMMHEVRREFNTFRDVVESTILHEFPEAKRDIEKLARKAESTIKNAESAAA